LKVHFDMMQRTYLYYSYMMLAQLSNEMKWRPPKSLRKETTCHANRSRESWCRNWQKNEMYPLSCFWRWILFYSLWLFKWQHRSRIERYAQIP